MLYSVVKNGLRELNERMITPTWERGEIIRMAMNFVIAAMANAAPICTLNNIIKVIIIIPWSETTGENPKRKPSVSPAAICLAPFSE